MQGEQWGEGKEGIIRKIQGGKGRRREWAEEHVLPAAPWAASGPASSGPDTGPPTCQGCRFYNIKKQSQNIRILPISTFDSDYLTF